MLKIYLRRIGREDLIDNIRYNITFLLYETKLKFGDEHPIEEIFRRFKLPYPNLIVKVSKIEKEKLEEVEDNLIKVYYDQIFEEIKQINTKIKEENKINYETDSDILNKFIEISKQFFKRLINTIDDIKYQKVEQMMEIEFHRNDNDKLILTFNSDTTIDEMLKIYLRRIDREDLIGEIGKEIIIYHSIIKLKLGDKTPIKFVFKSLDKRVVIVWDQFGHIDNPFIFSTKEAYLIDLYCKQILEESFMTIIIIRFINGLNIFKITMSDFFSV